MTDWLDPAARQALHDRIAAHPNYARQAHLGWLRYYLLRRSVLVPILIVDLIVMLWLVAQLARS
jgi:hypothetical protein